MGGRRLLGKHRMDRDGKREGGPSRFKLQCLVGLAGAPSPFQDFPLEGKEMRKRGGATLGSGVIRIWGNEVAEMQPGY